MQGAEFSSLLFSLNSDAYSFHANFLCKIMYLQFLSILHTDITQVDEILRQVTQGPT